MPESDKDVKMYLSSSSVLRSFIKGNWWVFRCSKRIQVFVVYFLLSFINLKVFLLIKVYVCERLGDVTECYQGV